MSDRTGEPRRYFLRLTGATTIAGLAGCSGDGAGDGGAETTTAGDDGAETTTAGDGENGLEPVPSEYETATSQGGTERDPDSVQTKESLNYQSSPKDGQQCSDCTYYIPDKNGDGMGACTLLEGTIDPEGWCASYVEQE
jgi:hypothetical protein